MATQSRRIDDHGLDDERDRDSGAGDSHAEPRLAADARHVQWVEKFRPKTFDELILPPRLSQQFREFVAAERMPNLLLSGPPGLGKTSAAKILSHEMIGEDNVLFINASDKRGIDIVRGIIQDYATTCSWHGGRKIVLLDEADSLTPDAQSALRALIEWCAEYCAFILTCNDPTKIIPALHSRCSVIEFACTPELKQNYIARACQILDHEGVEYDIIHVAEYIGKFFPDFRRTLNELQANAIRGQVQPISQTTLGHFVNGARVDSEHRVGDQDFGQQDDDGAVDGATPDPAPTLIRESFPPLPALSVPPSEVALLLDDLTAAFKRHMILPTWAAEAMALWAIHAHVHNAALHSPILAIVAPEKRCGKTTGLKLLSRLCPRALTTSNITPASVYRTVDEYQPTLLIDELETFLSVCPSFRGILNSCHDRELALVIRMEGGQLRAFSTWAALAVAVIGNLPETVADRSIIIRLERKRPDETVERLRPDNGDHLRGLGRRAALSAQEHMERLRGADPIIPAGLDDRAADNWRPLFAIADVAGGRWPELARKVAVMLSGNARVDESPGVIMLGDIRMVRNERGIDRVITTTDLLAALAAREDRPWPEWNGGSPITASQLARLLKPFGIRPTTIRIGTETAKGYRFADFDDAFARYLPPSVTE